MDLQGFVFSFFNPSIIHRYIPFIFRGMLVTIELGLVVVVTGLIAGFLLSFVRACGIRHLNFFIIVFADAMRSLPPLVAIIILFFAFPYINISMSAFTATSLALSLVLAAFAEEIFWAGIQATPKGLMEAGRSTGLTWFQSMWFVVWPYALKLTVPPLTNRVIAITKNTALGAVVGLGEVLSNAQSASSSSGSATPLTMCAIGCLLIFVPVVVAGRFIESRFR
jgi:polar amino acid transport system permease protein